MRRRSTQKLAQSLKIARQRIEQLFIDQCANGSQTTDMTDDSVAACGQFLGSDAKTVGQRGLHGTAAAIKVLSQVDDQRARALVPRLVKYAGDRHSIEHARKADSMAEQVLSDSKCTLDAQNVIKVGELLEAMAYAQQGAADVSVVLSELGSRLKNSIREGKGWYYFADEKRPPKMLPTAYAMMGLAAAGMYEDARIAEKYLTEELLRFYQSPSTSPEDSQTRAIHIACLYTVTFRKRPDGQVDTEGLRGVFQALWKRSHAELAHDDEQNVEYWRHLNKSCYVRVPWQLYLLALAGHYSFGWNFSRSAAQNLLTRTVRTASAAGGFVYPHSGQRPSARTNAVLHEVLGSLAGLLQHRDLGILPQLSEVVARDLRSWVARIIYLLVALAIIAYSLREACAAASPMWPQLAPGFIGAVVMLLLSAGLRWSKGSTKT